ncbi:hypothetical protein BX070DRAFT_80897 [Coemansia spiralis]|nr:hypothetical protein BX070DRAFT_80897 [Coemansia spiralis]
MQVSLFILSLCQIHLVFFVTAFYHLSAISQGFFIALRILKHPPQLNPTVKRRNRYRFPFSFIWSNCRHSSPAAPIQKTTVAAAFISLIPTLLFNIHAAK